MIDGLQVAKDAAGFPVVSWMEDRDAFSPEGVGRARVECRIMKDGKTGELLFVARGTVRDPHGKFEEGKPWARISGFSKHSAENLYRTKSESEFWRHVTSKNPLTKAALCDGALVLLAEFEDDAPIHINCADTPQNDIDRLHAALVREFMANQWALVGTLSGNLFKWPLGDVRVMTHDPKRTWWPDQPKPSLAMEALNWAMMVGLIGGALAAISWMTGLWRVV